MRQWPMGNLPDIILREGIEELEDRLKLDEQKIEQLGSKITALEQHICGLEALLASHGIVPPAAEGLPETPQTPKAIGEPVIFPARTDQTIACPRCGKKQKGNRDLCYSCKTPFQYETE